MILASNPVGFAGCAAAVRDMDLRDQLGLVDCPVMVVTGSHDQSVTPEQSQYIVQRIPGAQKIVLDAGHLSNVEQRDAFNQAVFDFLAGERI
jgi:3-oxoadipate enol-lactonase